MTFTPPPGTSLIPTAELERLRAAASSTSETTDALASISDDELLRQIQTAASGARADAVEQEPTAGLNGAEAAFLEQLLRD